VPSPYVWGATSIQRPGKYVADGVWSARTLDQQLGCAALIDAMSDLNASIQLLREKDDRKPAPSPFVPAKAGTQEPQNEALDSRLRGNERNEGTSPATSPPPRPKGWSQALRDWFSSLRNLVRKA
jgi:hypothetical protein